MFQIGPLELVVVLVIALLVLGPQRLPEVARAVGKGMREFRNAINLDDDDEPEVRPQVEPPKVEQTHSEPAHAEQPKAGQTPTPS